MCLNLNEYQFKASISKYTYNHVCVLVTQVTFVTP